MNFEHTTKVKELQEKLINFMQSNVYLNEGNYFDYIEKSKSRWVVPPIMEELKNKAKSAGLWNLFLPDSKYGAGLSNLEYAPLAEIMGRSFIASEIFNCSAPDTGNMEVLVRYGTKEQQEKWLKPLLDGEIRSAFAMTEPGVASSDATNISSLIENDGDNPCVCVVNFGFRNGAVGTLHISKLRRVFHGSGDQIILWDHGHISFDSDGPVAHYYDGPYPLEQPPAPAETRHPVLTKAHNDPLGGINQVFINAIADNRPESIKSPFSEAMNSLAAVLAANLSHELEGERIELQRFAKDERYHSFRNK